MCIVFSMTLIIISFQKKFNTCPLKKKCPLKNIVRVSLLNRIDSVSWVSLLSRIDSIRRVSLCTRQIKPGR